ELGRATTEDEVVLWFGPDLFCQMILLFLLDRFDQPPFDRVPLSLICVGSFPGVDDSRSCTLAFLSPDQLVGLWERRPAVNPTQRRLARRVWSAFTASTPLELVKLLDLDLTPLPFVRDAIVRLLQELPGATDGLSLTEHRILDTVRTGKKSVEQIFRAVSG